MRFFFLFISTLSFAFSAHQAAAQRLKSIPVDNGFVATPLGAPETRDGKRTYPFIAFHKVVQFNGDTYVCGGLFGALAVREEFIRKARIVASDGTVLKTGLTSFTKLNVPNEKRKTSGSGAPDPAEAAAFLEEMFSARLPAEPASFKGRNAGCERSRKKWRDVWADGKSVFTMPERLRINE